MQIFAGVRGFGALELLLKESAGALVNVEQSATMPCLRGLLRATSR